MTHCTNLECSHVRINYCETCLNVQDSDDCDCVGTEYTDMIDYTQRVHNILSSGVHYVETEEERRAEHEAFQFYLNAHEKLMEQYGEEEQYDDY